MIFKTRFPAVVQWLVTIAALVGVFFISGVSNVVDVIVRLNAVLLAVAVFWVLISLLVSAVNIWIMTQPIRKISLVKSARYYFFSWATGFFGLGKVGELSIIYWLRKEGIETGEATAIAILDKAITFATLLVLSAIGVVYFFGGSSEAVWILATGVLTLAAFVFFFLTAAGRGYIRRMLGKFGSAFPGFGRTADLFMHRYKRFLVANAFFTMVRWVTQGLFTVALFASFGVDVQLIPVLLVNSVATLVSLVPISVNGLGVKEASFASLAAISGWPLVETAGVLAVSLLVHYLLLGLILVLFARQIRAPLGASG